MTSITLTPEQEAILDAEPRKMIPVQRPDGTIAGFVTLTPRDSIFTVEELEEAKRRANSDEPRYTTEEVLKRLQSQDPRS